MPPRARGRSRRNRREQRRGAWHAALIRFLTDLRCILGPTALRRLARRLLANDTLPLAGQLAYLFVLFLFPFLIFMVSLAGLVISDPEPVLINVATRLEGVLPPEAVDPIREQLGHTLNSVSSPTFVGSLLFTLGVGSAAAQAITNAANRSYGVRETRPFWKVRGVAILLIFGFTLLVMILVFALLSVHTGTLFRRALGLPEAFLELWTVVSWALAFLSITVALNVLYYLAPNANVPFRWVTPGGFMATILMLASNQALAYFLTNVRYGQFYGPLGTAIVLMVWLYVVGFVVLVGLEMNAVLAGLAEERLGTEVVRPPRGAEGQRPRTPLGHDE